MRCALEATARVTIPIPIPVSAEFPTIANSRAKWQNIPFPFPFVRGNCAEFPVSRGNLYRAG